jgi:hypothetical protein
VYQENKLKPDILKFQEDTPTFAAHLHQLLMCQPLVAVSDKREDITQNANTTNLKTWGGGGGRKPKKNKQKGYFV